MLGYRASLTGLSSDTSVTDAAAKTTLQSRPQALPDGAAITVVAAYCSFTVLTPPVTIDELGIGQSPVWETV